MKTVAEVSKALEEASAVLHQIKALDKVIIAANSGKLEMLADTTTIDVSPEILHQAAIGWINRAKGALRSQGVDVGSDLPYPGVTFTGRRRKDVGADVSCASVAFEPELVPVVTSALDLLRATNGSWSLNKKGVLSLSIQSVAEAEPKRKPDPFAVVNGQVFLNQGEFDKHFLNLADLQISRAIRCESFQVRMDVTDDGKPFAAGFATADSYHWNKPEDLPPVGCDLLIKVPEDTKVVTAGKEGAAHMGYVTDKELIVKVFRTSHLADRAGDMEYRLPDNSTVTGRFPWTYP